MRAPLLALLLAPLAVAADPPEVVALRKKVAETESKLAELRAELAKAEGTPAEFKPGTLYPKKMGIGEEGPILNPSTKKPLAVHLVKRVVDADSFVIALWAEEEDDSLALVVEHPTKGLVDGQTFKAGRTWQVLGTRKVDGQTMYVIREARKELKGGEKK